VQAGGEQPKPPAGQTPAGQPAAPATPEQRIDELRAWIAQVDRKLGVRTYALGAALVLALAAGIVGVVLALSAKDESATKNEVRSLRDQVEAVQQEASEAAEQDVATLTERLDALEGRVNTIASGQRTTESELSVVQDDIEDLRNQISGLESSGAGGADNP
jgi:septal ring factor EnvC (AmiA/AmiB activator)